MQIDPGVSIEEFGSNVTQVSIPTPSISLPINRIESDLGRLLNAYQVVLVLGETASGKSTQLPQMLRRLGWCKNNWKMAVVQPNKLTARRLGERLTMELGNAPWLVCVQLSEEDTSNLDALGKAQIHVFDQQSFLRQALGVDPMLNDYSLVFLDEVHERTLRMDLILGLLKLVMANSKLCNSGSMGRHPIRLVLASATLDIKGLMSFFGKEESALVLCEGRQHQVHVAYLKAPTNNYLRTCLRVVQSIIQGNTSDGDVLVFLPSREDCEWFVQQSQNGGEWYREYQDVLVVPLHQGMSVKDQELVISVQAKVAKKSRKVIAATPVAETSITIPDIAYVVDSMFCQDIKFETLTNLTTRRTQVISKVRADQRMGRAGRNQPGKCYRLCTEEYFVRKIPKYEEPEILKRDLVDAVLLLKSFGIDNMCADFPFLTRPPEQALVSAFNVLYSLQALDANGQLTSLGGLLTCLPLSAYQGRVLINALKSGNQELFHCILDIVSCISSGVASQVLTGLSEHSVREFGTKQGDHLTLLNALRNHKRKTIAPEILQRYQSYRASLKRVMLHHEEMREDYRAMTSSSQEGNSAESLGDQILKCLVSGYFQHVAKLSSSGLYVTLIDKRPVRVHSSSILNRYGKPAEWICFQECVLFSSTHHQLQERDMTGRQEDIATVRLVSLIDPRWLKQVAPHFWTSEKI